MQERLQKYLARCGAASRRRAEDLIVQGRVAVNGETVTVLGTKVDPARDRVALDGKAIAPRPGRTYLALHKPGGYLTTRHDPHGRPTVYDLLPPDCAHLVPVGRLDAQSEGLLFFTDDGAWAQRVAHPRYGGDKEYAVLVSGALTSQQRKTLQAPMSIDGYRLNPVTVAVVGREQNGDTWLAMTLTEGRKRQIRHMLAAIGKRAARLIRVCIGPARLGNLAPGKQRPLTAAEIAHWREPTQSKNAEGVAPAPAPAARTTASGARADGCADSCSVTIAQPAARASTSSARTDCTERASTGSARADCAERAAKGFVRPDCTEHASTSSARTDSKERKAALPSETADRNGQP